MADAKNQKEVKNQNHAKNAHWNSQKIVNWWKCLVNYECPARTRKTTKTEFYETYVRVGVEINFEILC
jgi:hypothetical protein